MEPWSRPTVRWHPRVDCRAQHARLVSAGELLTRWAPAPFESTATDCFRLGQEYWIWQAGVGGIRFLADRPAFDAFPSVEVATPSFERLVTRSWLPAIYLVWGRQVLHASAVVWRETGDVVAFTGPSGAGKSTLAYGLAQRRGWGHVCDDTLAFSRVAHPARRQIQLHPLQNDTRLRPATAAYYGRSGEPPAPLRWPAGLLRLQRLYVLAGADDEDEAVRMTRLKTTDSYLRLLQQAHAFTLKIPAHNQRLMRDYLELATAVPTSRLAYRRSFATIDQVFDAIEVRLAANQPRALGP